MLSRLFGSDEEDESVDNSRRNVMRMAASSGAALGMVGMAAANGAAQEIDEDDLEPDCDDYNHKVTAPAPCNPNIDDPVEDENPPAITSACNTGSVGPCDGVTCCWDDCADHCSGECVPQVENSCRVETFLGCVYTSVCNCRCSSY